MKNPYGEMPAEAFWRTAVADKEPLAISNIWKPRFKPNANHLIATSGSCFAQHISKALTARGYSWLDGEPAPQGLATESRQAFNYGVFSFRTGNIYTTALLKQWLKWALLKEPVPDEVWIKADRYYDPFRPAIEPDGFCCLEELQASRADTLAAIVDVFSRCKLFIFTLGLTEAWVNSKLGYVYPMCPGTVAGEFDETLHSFVNYNYYQIRADLRESFDLIKKINPKIKFLLTVSPVPLTATASNNHVLVATTYSKSTLRAVAGDLVALSRDVDYFPSYELVTSFPFRGSFYEKNLRSVSVEGVNFVMDSFFSCLNGNSPNKGFIPSTPIVCPTDSISEEENDVVCEEEMLAAFGAKEVG